MVKNFIKELIKVSPGDDNYEKAVKLLTDLYALICEACNVYLFSTDDPFRSIGWKQPDFFQLLVTRTFANGYSRESISRMMLLATTGGLSRESLYILQETVLLGGLKTSDVKYMAIEEGKKLVEEREEKLKERAGNKYDSRQYYIREAVNELCSMIFIITMTLAEAEDGMAYFFKHCTEPDKEITLYRALDLADWMDEDDLWIKVYEYGIKKKIRPRDSSQEEYRKRQGVKAWQEK